MTGRLHIGLLGRELDDVGVSFTVCRSLLFAMKDDGQKLPARLGRNDVQRFMRQG
jgi:hypothetical protein